MAHVPVGPAASAQHIPIPETPRSILRWPRTPGTPATPFSTFHSPMLNSPRPGDEPVGEGPVREYDFVEQEGGLERATSGASDIARALNPIDAAPAAAPFSLGFFDPSLKQARITYAKIVLLGGFLCSLVVYCILSIYWGALWKVPDHKLDGWLIDFDGSFLGQEVIGAFANDTGKSAKVKWHIIDPASVGYDPAWVAHQIVEEEAWLAVVVQAGASANLTSAVQNRDASYDSTNAVSVYVAEARQENAIRIIVHPYFQDFLDKLSVDYARRFANNLASTNEDTVADLLATAPQVVTKPLGWQFVNLVPFDIPVVTAIDFVGLIYTIVLCFFIVLIGAGARLMSGIEAKLTTAALVKMRLASLFIGYFFISLFYSLLSRAFEAEFDRKFGSSGFVIFWCLNFCGMLALGLAMESMYTILTHRFMPYFLFLWIITNVSVSYMPIQVLPHIYRYGYAWPLYNIGRAVRTIIFGTKNQLGLNFGVLIAWMTVSIITLPLFQWFMRRGAIKQAQAEALAAAQQQEHDETATAVATPNAEKKTSLPDVKTSHSAEASPSLVGEKSAAEEARTSGAADSGTSSR
ncbi:hypothetical protein CYLTODRAFT_417169 [Cylindrobasidium torrendii FP15055 ss-10]|uniref:DUF3533 domain-containing protein n=1 Tax=Cylindrobasidium torrendii FP15055 ss-10 TaxID=1314674 RepID=A0A0D7BRQ0_9AGAR|nr:hypothetical protein CYLTODRAFT_417169 [Cylindrobasidium torrendii FP15055 ss-10]